MWCIRVNNNKDVWSSVNDGALLTLAFAAPVTVYFIDNSSSCDTGLIAKQEPSDNQNRCNTQKQR